MKEKDFKFQGQLVNILCEYRLIDGLYLFVSVIGNPAFSHSIELEGGKLSEHELISKLGMLPEFKSINRITNCYDTRWDSLVREVTPILQYIKCAAEELLPSHLRPVD